MPPTVKNTCIDASVLPVRVMVNRPPSAPASVATPSVAATDTLGGTATARTATSLIAESMMFVMRTV